MDVAGVGPTDILAHLTNCFEIGQTLDVANGAADLGDDDVDVVVTQFAYPCFDLIGDMGNHLDGGAQVVTTSLLTDDRLVHGTRSHI